MTGVSGLHRLDARADEPPTYEVYAVRYGTAPGCPVSLLVQGAEKERKVDLAFASWVLKGPSGRTVLVDAGFHRPRFFKDFEGITDYTRPNRAVGRLGIKPEEVTDVIITHMHSDHFSALMRLNGEGRVRLVDGDAWEIIPGVTVYTGGKDTFASQYLGVDTKSGRMVVASDYVYLYENLDKHAPITATLDAKSNLAAWIQRCSLASRSLEGPGLPSSFSWSYWPMGGRTSRSSQITRISRRTTFKQRFTLPRRRLSKSMSTRYPFENAEISC